VSTTGKASDCRERSERDGDASDVPVHGERACDHIAPRREPAAGSDVRDEREWDGGLRSGQRSSARLGHGHGDAFGAARRVHLVHEQSP
jgi:hypothetical protein